MGPEVTYTGCMVIYQVAHAFFERPSQWEIRCGYMQRLEVWKLRLRKVQHRSMIGDERKPSTESQ